MEKWKEFLDHQELILGKETVNRWLRTFKVVHFDACNLYLETQDSFQLSWFEEHMRAKVRAELFNNNGRQIKVHITCPDIKKKEKPSKGAPEVKSFLIIKSAALDPSATLDHFVVSPANQIPYRFLQELSQNSDTIGSLNPIYLFGNSGVGKTHLLTGLAHRFQAKGLKTFLVHAESFTDHVVSAIRGGNMQQFRDTYRSVDVLLIDDIQLLSKRHATQEELFHTFNYLHVEKKQIILSADRAPQALSDIEQRLISRFEWGITLQLHSPSPEDFLKILNRRAEALQFPLNEELTAFLTTTFPRSISSLLQGLEAIVLRSHLQGKREVTAEEAGTMLADLIAKEKKALITPQKIIKLVSRFYGIPSEEILGKSQSQECSIPRQIAMFLCRQQLKLPYLAIGNLFSRDHSTVISSVRLVQKKLDEKDDTLITALANILKSATTEIEG
jgi:chromosomal replication initiator protein